MSQCLQLVDRPGQASDIVWDNLCGGHIHLSPLKITSTQVVLNVSIDQQQSSGLHKPKQSANHKQTPSSFLNATRFCKLLPGLPLLTGCEIQGLFQDFPGPFRANSRTFCTSKAYLLSINSEMSFTRFASKEKSSLHLCFQTLLHCTSNVLCPVMTNSSFWLFLAYKGKKLCPFQDFQGPQSKLSLDFPGSGIFFYQFQDFSGLSRIVATPHYLWCFICFHDQFLNRLRTSSSRMLFIAYFHLRYKK